MRRNLRKTICMLLAGAMVFTACPASNAGAAAKKSINLKDDGEEEKYDWDDHTTGDYVWKYKDYVVGNDIVINGYNGDSNDVVFPAELDGKKVRSIDGYTLYDIMGEKDYSFVHSIVVSEGIEEIQSNAFASLKNCTYVKLPSTLKKLGGYSFCWGGLESVVLNRGLTSIEASSFSGDDALTSITIPASVTSVNKDAFSDTGLKYVFYMTGDTSYSPEVTGEYSDLYEKAVKLYADTEYSSVSYDNRYKEPEVTVKTAAGSKAAVVSADQYTVSYIDNRDIGEAVAKVTFKEDSDYPGACAFIPFMITEPAADELKITPYEHRFNDKTTITISGGKEDSEIVYTTDGTDPDTESSKYTEPFEITGTTVVKAAELSNGKVGDIISEKYVKAEKYELEGSFVADAVYGEEASDTESTSQLKAVLKDKVDVVSEEDAGGNIRYTVTYTVKEGTLTDPAGDVNGQDVEDITYSNGSDGEEKTAVKVYDNTLAGIRKFSAEYSSLPEGLSVTLVLSDDTTLTAYVSIKGESFTEASSTGTDTEELEGTISGAEKMLDSDIVFSESTLKELNDTVSEAKKAAENKEITGEEAGLQIKAIQKAYSGLKLKGPKISPENSKFDDELGEVTITPSNEGAKIYYETADSAQSAYYDPCDDPTEESAEYDTAVTVDEDTTTFRIKAIEVLDGFTSDVTAKTYTKRQAYEKTGTYRAKVRLCDFPSGLDDGKYIQSLVSENAVVTVRKNDDGEYVYDLVLSFITVSDEDMPSEMEAFKGKNWNGQKITEVSYAEDTRNYNHNNITSTAAVVEDNVFAGIRKFRFTFKNFPGIEPDTAGKEGNGNMITVSFDGSDSLTGDNAPDSYVLLTSEDDLPQLYDLNDPDYMDTSELEATVASAEALDLKGYTEETGRVFSDALEDAKKAAEDLDLTQDTADKAVSEILKAYAGLVEKKEVTETEDPATVPAIELKDNEVLAGTGSAAAALEKGKTYTVPVKLMNSSRTDLKSADYYTNDKNLSMAAACVSGPAVVKAGTESAAIVLNLGPLSFGGQLAWGKEWSYFPSGTGKGAEAQAAEVLEKDSETGNPVKIRLTVPVEYLSVNGLYVTMTADGMPGASTAVVVFDWKNSKETVDTEPSPNPTETSSPVATETAAPEATGTVLPEETATVSPEETATAAPGVTDTATPEATVTATPEETATAAPEATDTATPEETATAVPEATDTATPEETATAAPEAADTATPEETATAVPEATKTAVPEETVTASPEETATTVPETTETAVPAATETAVPANTSSPSAEASGKSEISERSDDEDTVITVKNGSKKVNKVKVKKGKKVKLTISANKKNADIKLLKISKKNKKIAKVTLKGKKLIIKGKKKGSFKVKIKSGDTIKVLKIKVK